MTEAKSGKKNLTGMQGIKDLATLQNASQEDKILLLTIDQILVKKQVRRSFRKIEQLAQSFRTEGQQSPIIVSPKDPNTGKYELQKGGRRVKAAELIPGFTLKAIVDSKARKRSDHKASQVIENIQRDDLLPHELGQAILEIKQDMIEEGEKATGRALAEKLGVPESYISKYLEIADIPDDLAELIEDDITTDSDLIHGLKQIYVRSPVIYRELIARARSEEEGGVTRQVVREHLKIAKGQAEVILSPEVLAAKQREQKEVQTAGENNTATQSSAVQIQQPSSGTTQAGNTENISHAKTSGDQQNNGVSDQPASNVTSIVNGKKPATPSVDPAGTQPRERRLGKNETMEIVPADLVIGISVSFPQKVLCGELLTHKVLGDPSKAWVSVIDGGKQIEKIVAVDDITIMSLAKIARDD
ncbi:ParB/RepB/Spo0J family partition protein [Pseudomonas sp. NPDC089569]|uniref:ParB/RepB/Spo0J family partition protein n=1 Tax=Pseudomonas sp. NPDC089569 TaxID=3390722 RepID=UPI003D07DB39